MKNWKYFEVIATYFRTYFIFISQGQSTSDANNRNLEDFWFLPNEENILINLIVLIQYIHIEISTTKMISKQIINKFYEQLKMLNNDLINDYLDNNEQEHLQELIEELKYQLESLP
jgi:hypothetical protein